ncbi:hypothetical protein ABT127_12340 [Streptomyces sp. NPDC001904]
MRAICRVLLKPLFGKLREEMDEGDLGSVPSEWLETEQESSEDE